mmetsp:Transcript_18178/g.42505  ORF Transcript_18178/g.42505 Transcript_18178/m.42505 type:complete len:720 (+) Transcript_18178:3-2162(+)
MTDTFLVMISILGLLLTTLQQVGVVSLITLEWTEPLRTVVRAMRLLAFDIEFLRLGCVGPVRPLSLFVMRLLVIFIAIAVLLLSHGFLVLVFHKGQFKKYRSTLVAAIGSVTTVFYISVITTMTGPLQCQAHPNGKWTVREYQSVQCWEDETHSIMVILSGVALLMPATLLAVVCRVVWLFPAKVQIGDQDFLNAFRFLFLRFDAEAYYYVPFPLIRSFLLAITVVIPSPLVAVYAVQIILLFSAGLSTRLMPWRSPRVNYVDILFHLSIVAFLSAALVYVPNVNKSGRQQLAWLCVFYLMTALSVVPLMMLYALTRKLVPKRKTYDFFLCHHKLGAGAFTRLLKIHLIEAHPRRKVFVDADNLSNLHFLFNHVRDETDTLVAISSRQLLLRPWCVGELTVTRLSSIRIVPIHMPDYNGPSENFIVRCADLVDLTVLLEYGISKHMAQETFRWFRDLKHINFQLDLSNDVMVKLCKNVEIRKLQTSIELTSQACFEPAEWREKSVPTIIAPDTRNSEAIASAMVLEHIMRPILVQYGHEALAHVLTNGMVLPKKTARVVCILSAGCLESIPYLKMICSIIDEHVDACYPVVVQESFSFPNKEGMQRAAELSGHGQAFADFATNLFREIATTFDAQHAGENMLKLAANKLMERMYRRMQNASSTHVMPKDSLSSVASVELNDVEITTSPTCETAAEDTSPDLLQQGHMPPVSPNWVKLQV